MYCKVVERTPECAGLQRALIRDNRAKVGSLQKSQGEFTPTHFPECKPTQNAEVDQMYPDI